MKFYTGYGDQKPFNKDGVDQGKIHVEGNEYLRYGGTILYTLCKSVLSILAQANRLYQQQQLVRYCMRTHSMRNCCFDCSFACDCCCWYPVLQS
jgi:hypothetical protein